MSICVYVYIYILNAIIPQLTPIKQYNCLSTDTLLMKQHLPPCWPKKLSSPQAVTANWPNLNSIMIFCMISGGMKLPLVQFRPAVLPLPHYLLLHHRDNGSSLPKGTVQPGQAKL